MSILHDLGEESGAARAYAGVYALLEREAEKSKLNGDLETAELYEILLAKVKALEKAP